MKAVLFKANPAGWVACKFLRRFWRNCLTSKLNGFSLRDVAIPELPTDDWVLVKTLLGGICGSDTAIAAQKQPPDSLLQAYTSQPIALGHENVCVVTKTGPNVDSQWVGKRVVVEPTLGCEVRGTEPMCPRCAVGEFGACENFSGDFGGAANLPAGTSIGYNARTGGSWGEYFVAHKSQLIALDDSISDEVAIMVDPLACSLHAVLRANLAAAEKVLVYGAGMLGLGTVAALRAVGFSGRIETLDRPAGRYLADTATRLGADEFFTLPSDTSARFAEIAGRTGATVQRARFGNYMLSGGYDLVFDCVGSRQSVMECLKWTRGRGQVIMLGTLQGAVPDLTPLWFRELEIIGAWGRSMENYDGRNVNTYQLVLDLIGEGKIAADGLLTHTFKIDDYRAALAAGMYKPQCESIKVAFDFR
ncbi:MAG: alcohol dehydrogenase catalytic domain-containing protein [Phycisphaerae bacterium]|nr:alcohol dehydrogenase catalytic domain-containing protein [Phycisphaerae bacterium]